MLHVGTMRIKTAGTQQGKKQWSGNLHMLSNLNHVAEDSIILLCTLLLSPAKLPLNQAVTTLNIP